jgi:hypothetical protein
MRCVWQSPRRTACLQLSATGLRLWNASQSRPARGLATAIIKLTLMGRSPCLVSKGACHRLAASGLVWPVPEICPWACGRRRGTKPNFFRKGSRLYPKLRCRSLAKRAKSRLGGSVVLSNIEPFPGALLIGRSNYPAASTPLLRSTAFSVSIDTEDRA